MPLVRLAMLAAIAAAMALALDPASGWGSGMMSPSPMPSVPSGSMPSRPSMPSIDRSGGAGVNARDAAGRSGGGGGDGALGYGGGGGGYSPDYPAQGNLNSVDDSTKDQITAAINAPDPIDPAVAQRFAARTKVLEEQANSDTLQQELEGINREIDRAWAGRSGGGNPPLSPQELTDIGNHGGTDKFIQDRRDFTNNNLGPRMDQNKQAINDARSAASAINAWQE
jgi:hypothetical protein